MTITQQLWSRLSRVRTLTFVARSTQPGGWNGEGSGTVAVELLSNGVLTFTESGLWRPDTGGELHFRNVFRWTLLESAGAIRLEHLRFGPDQPVHLLDLAPSADGEWRSVSPHLCSADCYTAWMTLNEDRIDLCWRVTGPKKQQAIDYRYA